MRTVPVLTAVISTSLLAYFVLSAESSRPYAQLQQQPSRQEVQRQLAQNGPQRSTPEQAKHQPQTPGAPPLRIPSDDVLVMLIRSTLVALNQANATGNYTVFRELGAPGFQEANNAARLAEAFANLRHRNLDLSPILLFQPKLYRKPEINSQGILRITGFFPTEPERVNFDLLFEPVHGQWRLFGLAADTARVEPAATGPVTQPSPAPVPEAAAPWPPTASQVAKPAAPAPDTATKQPSKPQVDIRDRLQSLEVGPTPPPDRPTSDETYNPLNR